MMRLRMNRRYFRMKNSEDDLDSCEDKDIYSLIGSTIVAKHEPGSAACTTATTVTRAPSYLRGAPYPIPTDNSSTTSVTTASEAGDADLTAEQRELANYAIECNRLLANNHFDACVAKCRICLRMLESKWGRYTQATVDAYHTIGQAFYQRHDYDEALVTFRTANRIDEYLALELQKASADHETTAASRNSRQRNLSLLQRQLDSLRKLDGSVVDDGQLSTTSTITNTFQGSLANKTTELPSIPDLNPHYALRDELTKAILLLRSSSPSSPATSVRIDKHVHSHRRSLQQSVRQEYDGDVLRAKGQFKAAAQKYCKAISTEEAAFGGTVGLDLAFLWRKLACIVNLRNVAGPDDFGAADLIRPAEGDALSGDWLKAVQHRMPSRVRQAIQTGDAYYTRSQYQESIVEYRKATIIGRYYYCDHFHRAQSVRSQSLMSSSLLSGSFDSGTSIPWYFKILFLASLMLNVVVIAEYFEVDTAAILGGASSAVSEMEHKDLALVGLVVLLISSQMFRSK